jgi:hypothetical protein
VPGTRVKAYSQMGGHYKYSSSHLWSTRICQGLSIELIDL